jgi:predicted phosphodiesterase
MRIAVLSDIHANLVALDAVLDSIGPVDALWHLGDVVGYGPEPDAVVDRLRDAGARGVRGNHDAAAIGGREIDYFNPDAKRAMEWTRGVIRPETIAWLTALPERLTDGDFLLVHGSPRDPIWEYVTSAAIARENLAVAETPHVLHGHTHVAVAFRDDGDRTQTLVPRDGATLPLDDGRAMVNPGSVGQPRDGNPDASWLVLDTDRHECTWHRVAYDIESVQAAMLSAGLPARLASRLSFGM